MEQKEKSDKNNDRYYAKWIGIGTEFVGVLGIFCYIGYRIDKRLDTSPWFLLAGFATGFAFMLYTIVKESRKIWGK